MSSLLDPYNPLTWLFGSLAVAVITTNLAWLVGRLGKRSRAGSAILRWSGLPAVGWLLASLFFLVPPVVAWRYGTLSPYLMGLTELDWVEDLGSGGPLAALIVGLLLFGWLVYRHYLPPGRSPGRSERLGRTLRAPLDAGLQQWHWAFYRALVIGLLPATVGRLPTVPFVSSLAQPFVAQPVYWGSWLGLALIGVEWVLNPFARASLRRPIRREATLRRVSPCDRHNRACLRLPATSGFAWPAMLSWKRRSPAGSHSPNRKTRFPPEKPGLSYVIRIPTARWPIIGVAGVFARQESLNDEPQHDHHPEQGGGRDS